MELGPVGFGWLGFLLRYFSMSYPSLVGISWIKEVWVWLDLFQLGICLVWFDEVSIMVMLL